MCRRRNGRGFVYVDEQGQQVRDRETLCAGLATFAVPPAYENVRIARDPSAHLQAMGRDAAGRIQYRYDPDWDAVREARKVERLGALSAVLPACAAQSRATCDGRCCAAAACWRRSSR